jgi:(p)ppGpp synthase/HD superfamily hydrolase
MEKILDVEFDRAVRLLAKIADPSDETARKPLLPHDVRVGVYLYENNYSREVVLAGILHDTLEFTGLEFDDLKEEFGEVVARLVEANTKDDTIADKDEKRNDLIRRCIAAGQESLIVKAADTIDSCKYYSRVGKEEQLKNHCLPTIETIMKLLPPDFTDPIFGELKGWQERLLAR